MLRFLCTTLFLVAAVSSYADTDLPHVREGEMVTFDGTTSAAYQTLPDGTTRLYLERKGGKVSVDLPFGPDYKERNTVAHLHFADPTRIWLHAIMYKGAQQFALYDTAKRGIELWLDGDDFQYSPNGLKVAFRTPGRRRWRSSIVMVDDIAVYPEPGRIPLDLKKSLWEAQSNKLKRLTGGAPGEFLSAPEWVDEQTIRFLIAEHRRPNVRIHHDTTATIMLHEISGFRETADEQKLTVRKVEVPRAEFLRQLGPEYNDFATTETVAWASTTGTNETIEHYKIEARDNIPGPVYREVKVGVESRLAVKPVAVLTTAGLVADTTGPLQLLDFVGGAPANAVHYRGRHFVPTGCRLAIYDADTTTGEEMAHVLLPARIQSIQVMESPDIDGPTLVAVLVREKEVHIFDVPRSEKPLPVGMVIFPDDVSQIETQPDRIYVAGKFGVGLIDLKYLYDIKAYIAGGPAWSATGIAANGADVYAFDPFFGMKHILWVDPEVPTVVATTPLPKFGGGVVRRESEDTILVNIDYTSHYAVDITTPTAPRVSEQVGRISHDHDASIPAVGAAAIARRNQLGAVRHLARTDDPKILIAATEDELLTLDTSTLHKPRVRGRIDIRSPWNMITSGSLVIASTYISGVHIIDISNPDAPERLAVYAEKDFRRNQGLTSLSLNGNTLYIGATRGVVEAVDISDPTSPTLAASHDGVTNYNKVVTPVPGRRLLFSGSEIFELDLEGLTPTKRKLGSAGVWAFDVATSGGLCYVASSLDTLHVLDCRNPGLPVALAKIKVPNSDKVKLAGNLALLLPDQGFGPLTVVDVSDPRNPTILPLSIHHRAYGAAAIGNTLYVALSNEAGVAIVSLESFSR